MPPKRKLDHKLVFIPPWLRQVQSTYSLPDSELLSLASLLDILTLEDVSFYYTCSEEFKNSDNTHAFTNTFDMVDLFTNTRKIVGDKNQIILDGNHSDSLPVVQTIDIEKTLEDVSANAFIMGNHIKTMRGYTNNMDNTIAAMQQPLSKIDLLQQNFGEHVRDNYVFEMLPINDKYIGVTFTKGSEVSNHTECYKQCIEFLCGMYPLETVAQTSIFSSWTDVISIN